MNREEWFLKCSKYIISDVFKAHKVPEFKVSVGFPKGNVRKVIGQAWCNKAASDGIHQVFISPTIDEATRALDIFVHELCHLVAGIEAGHGTAFKRVARSVGLEGKLTETTASEALMKRLNVVIEKVGKYPHSALNLKDSPIKKQGTRLIKCECPCGYTVRVTRKWIDELGTPFCPCGGQMLEDA